jgi:hypothetical protein
VYYSNIKVYTNDILGIFLDKSTLGVPISLENTASDCTVVMMERVAALGFRMKQILEYNRICVCSADNEGTLFTAMHEVSDSIALIILDLDIEDSQALELLKETISKLLRVAILWDPQNPGAQEEWKETQRGARNLGLQLYSMEVSSLEEYPKAFSGRKSAQHRVGRVVDSIDEF